MRSRLRFLGMGLTLLALALGLWAGLELIGWPIGSLTEWLPAAHGVLMVNGVLASLIGIERAVALKRRVFYLAPVLTAAGAIWLGIRGETAVAFDLVTLGAIVLAAIFGEILHRQPALYTAVMLVGATCLAGGDLLGAGGLDIPYLIPWWGSFLILLIAAERLELSRIVHRTRLDRWTFAIPVALAVAGCLISVVGPTDGLFVTASGWLLIAVWLLVHDIAYRNLGRPGLPRFTAVALLPGYGWLLFGSGLILRQGGLLPGLTYDAALHSIFLGFVLSLVFAHAPVILPAVLGRPVPFSRVLYLPLGVLHSSLALRIYADLAVLPALRTWAGLFNVAAIVGFGVSLLVVLVLERSSYGAARRSDVSAFFP